MPMRCDRKMKSRAGIGRSMRVLWLQQRMHPTRHPPLRAEQPESEPQCKRLPRAPQRLAARRDVLLVPCEDRIVLVLLLASIPVGVLCVTLIEGCTRASSSGSVLLFVRSLQSHLLLVPLRESPAFLLLFLLPYRLLLLFFECVAQLVRSRKGAVGHCR